MRKSKASEALRVATDIVAIKTALKKHGYTIRKQPRQATWAITPLSPSLTRGETGGCYKLTYQPAPISAWVLHPQNDNPNRQTLLNIIHSTLVLQPINTPRARLQTFSIPLNPPF
ncbi:MAG TPA: hypothetical protein V6C95_06130 [Coleofasciculaceae cyanobacterium]